MTSFAEQVRRKAEQLWLQNGRPAGGPGQFRDDARQLAAIVTDDGLAMKHNPIREAGAG